MRAGTAKFLALDGGCCVVPGGGFSGFWVKGVEGSAF